MTRREFITLLCGTAAWPMAARAQRGERMRRIGVVLSTREDDPQRRAQLAALVQRLTELGWADGHNARLDVRWTAGSVDAARKYAAELVALAPDVIITDTSFNVAAVQQVTRTVPIVFGGVIDPVGAGLVDSLARPGGNTTGFTAFEYAIGAKWLELLKDRPGGNATGVSAFSVTLEAKRLELLHELVPKATTIGVLLDPTFSLVDLQLSEVQTAARATGHELRVLSVSSDADIDAAFSTLVEIHAGGLVVGGNPFLNSRRNKLIALAARHAIPAVYEPRESSIAGGLMNYGPSITDVYRQVGVYTGRILKGEKPADLPVLQPTKFELVINLRTAKVLGLDVPAMLLARADEVIE